MQPRQIYASSSAHPHYSLTAHNTCPSAKFRYSDNARLWGGHERTSAGRAQQSEAISIVTTYYRVSQSRRGFASTRLHWLHQLQRSNVLCSRQVFVPARQQDTYVMFVTQDYDFDLGSGFAGKVTIVLTRRYCTSSQWIFNINTAVTLTSNRRSEVKNTLGWSAVASCECELILLYEIKLLLCFIWLELCINLTLGLLQLNF